MGTASPSCRVVALLAGCLLAHPTPGHATGAVELALAVESISGDNFELDGIRLGLTSAAGSEFSTRLSVDRLVLPDDHGVVAGVELTCSVQLDEQLGWQCDEGRLAATDSPVGAQQASWSGRWGVDGGELKITGLAVAAGRLTLHWIGTPTGEWSLQVTAYRHDPGELAALLPAVQLPRDWGIRGRLSGSVTARGANADLQRLNADLVVDGLYYASPDGAQAGEDLLLKIDANARRRGTTWQVSVDLGCPRGAAYSEPVFIDAGATPLRVVAEARWLVDAQRVELDGASLTVDDTLTLNATAGYAIRAAQIDDFTLTAHSRDAGLLYERLVQPFLLGTPGDDLDVTGQVGFVLHYDTRGIAQAGVQLNGLALSDRQGRFALDATDGSLGWERDGAGSVSHLSTRGVGLYRVGSEPFEVAIRAAGERVELVDPLVIPLLDGRVTLDAFTLDGAGLAGQQPRWRASASIAGLSLERLTAAFGWPSFDGTLDARLRDMRYADRSLAIGGGLEIRAFDGEIRIDDLAIRDPLGVAPVLSADATLRGLNLEAVTRTFSFGLIEGRLDGDLAGLRLVAWRPDVFDLHLYTPPDDDSRRRISQRAVDNLTSLGSGVPAGLSTGLLSLFEEFRYSAIDLQVALRGNTAELDGLARDDGGYYLVKGAGLPRIDVIGRNRSVAWPVLLERLRQIRVEGAQFR